MSKTIAIHSFRGGTGKSNLTANLAAIVAREGHQVGIVDTDIQSPGIHVLFNLDEERITYALNDYLWGHCSIEQTAYDVTPPEVGEVGGAVQLIPSSIKAGEIARVLREGYDVGMLNDGFHKLIDHLALDYLFIDTHPGLNEETLLSIAISDLLLILLRPDKQDYLGTAVTVEVARKLEVPDMLLLINKALPSLDYAALRQHVQSTYQAPVGGIIAETEDMLALGSSGLFCLYYPDHPVTAELTRLAARLTGERVLGAG